MKSPVKVGAAVRDLSPLPAAPAWAGYWTWTTAVILIMFVLFVARKGTLSNWLAFFSWTAPASLANDSASSTAGTGQAGSPSVVPTVNSLWNFVTGHWYTAAQTTSQGTQTPAGSSAATAAGAGIGHM